MSSDNAEHHVSEQNHTSKIETQDGSVEVSVSNDQMEAYIEITPPSGDGNPVIKETALQILAEHSIVYGVIEENITRAIAHPLNRLVVALGKKPTKGTDAYIDFKYLNDHHTAGKPKELLNGRVDFYNLNLIQNVKEGDVLAIKIKPTVGENGMNVLGEEVPAKPGKDTFIIPGRNVVLKEDNCVAIATANGHVVIKDNKISVSSVYEVNGDVDFKTGNIEFNGSVFIKGSINEGFKVKADGDVEVMNVVSDGIVECGGSLKVKNGIIGRNNSHIKARGNVYTKFIENSIVEAGGDVLVEEVIMHSQVTSNGSVLVEGKGVIAGGKIRATREITCRVAGANLGTVTELETGINTELRQVHKQLLEKKKEKELNLDKAEKARNLLNNLLATNQTLEPQQYAIIEKLANAFEQMKGDLEAANREISDLEKTIAETELGRINVQGKIHSGVRATIGIAIKHFREDHQFVSLTRNGADIVISPFCGKLS